MHIEISPHPMACTVHVVKSCFPQVFSRHGIKLCAACPFGKLEQLQLDVPFEHQSIYAAFLFGDGAKGYGSCNVGGTIKILCTRIKQQQSLSLQRHIRFRSSLIMHDGAVRPITGNGIK